MQYIEAINNALFNANSGISKLSDEILALDGMSGKKTRHFYNNLISNIPGARYLEIGMWKGSSLCSAMYGNKATIVAIDNWSEFEDPRKEFMSNLVKYSGLNQVEVIEKDCFDIDVNKLGKFNIYMYDGNHTEESHYKSLTHFIHCMDDVFIFIVDDWNWESVRNGTFRAIKDLQLTTLFQHEVRLTYDNSHTPMDMAHKTWWNGIYICVLQKPVSNNRNST